MQNKLIALTGRAGAGKSTAAQYLQERYGYSILSLAFPLKRFLVEECGVPSDYVYKPDLKEMVPPGFIASARYMLQTLGTEWGRQIVREDVWIENLMRRTQDYEVVCCDDVRFSNEALDLKDRGATIWKIIGSNDNAEITHASESGIPDALIDVFIDNTNDKTNLYSQIDTAIRNSSKR